MLQDCLDRSDLRVVTIVVITFVFALLSQGASVGEAPGEGPALAPINITQDEIESGKFSLLELRRIGRQIFSTPFNKLDGYGDGPFIGEDPTTFGGRPTLQGNGTFLRVNGLDAQTCVECHFALSTREIPMTFAVGGFGGANTNALFAPTVIDVADTANAGLASWSSALLPAKFTDGLKGRARCLVVHPINPPYLVPAAEVVPAPWTDQAVVDRTREFLISAGHAPIVMKKELDGFVMNRMQGALLEEAFRLVADGYASIEDVDIGIREGLALRWSFMGPFETIDLNAPGGVRDYVERYQGIYERLHASQQRRVDWLGEVMDRVEGDRRKDLPADKLAERQVWRDRRLMALAAHKRRADEDIGK